MIAETVFQSIDSSLSILIFLVLISTIVLCVLASRAIRILNNLREIEGHLHALRSYEENDRKRNIRQPEEPLPPSLELTERDLEASRPRAASREKIFQVKRGDTFLGPFSEMEFREKIFSNEIEPTDLYRSDDALTWTPISNYRAHPPPIPQARATP